MCILKDTEVICPLADATVSFYCIEMEKRVKEMNNNNFIESQTAKMLEFDTVINKLMELACTEHAKMDICRLEPYLSEIEVCARLHETTEAKIMLEKCGNPPISSLVGIDDLIMIAEKGGCLTAEQLEQVAIYLTAVKRLKDYLNRCKNLELSLAYYEENMDSLENVREEINGKIRCGKVDDYATKLLKQIRESILKADTKMREKADAVIRANKECMSDSFSTFRNGHVCIPVKKEYKNRISGSVMDKSSTGNTLFIEPTAAAAYYEELQELKIDEENEERRILYTLTAMLADTEDVMKKNNYTMEKLDFIFAKAKLSLEYDGTEPIINTERRIKLVNGRHPLMEKSQTIPLNFQIGNEVNGIIITGPNTGGKTVAIKTVALNCMMAQCGLHVACEQADICMNDLILCDIGDGQNLSENLSTFSAHITNVLEILKRAGRESLVIMDELGSGTDPAEGMGIAIAILEELKKSKALYLVTTHYPEVKTYAEKENGVVNARMTFDKESLKPLYQLVLGEAGESCAFYIAKKLGMPGSMLNRAASAAYGNQNVVTNIASVSEPDMIFDDKESLMHEKGKQIKKKKAPQNTQNLVKKFQRGDSVILYPDKKIGIVCEPINEKGVLRVQLPDKKIWINHKRVKLHVSAGELYPEDYDFSILFDSVENRKNRHQMERKYIEGLEIRYED